jgi:hypothetical protein
MVPRGDAEGGIQGWWFGLGTWPNGPPARSGHLAKRAPGQVSPPAKCPCVAPKRDFSRPALRRVERAIGTARWSTAPALRPGASREKPTHPSARPMRGPDNGGGASGP